MNEEFNIEKLEALLRKAQESSLNKEELKFLEENGIDSDTIAFMVEATSPESEVEFENASHVKSEVLKHFKEVTPQTNAGTPSEPITRKILDFKPLLKYAAIFIVSMGAIATTYFIINFEEINNDNVAINEPTHLHTLEEVTLGTEDSMNQPIDEIANKLELPKNNSTPPPPPSVPLKQEIYNAEIEAETMPIGIIAEQDAEYKLNELVDKENATDLVNDTYSRSNTIVRAEKSIGKSDDKIALKENKKATSYTKNEEFDSQLVGPYPGGMAQLKIDLKKEIKHTKKYADDSHITVNVIPAGDGTLKDVEIVSTNDAQFAADVVAALKRLKNWEIGNTRKQNYLFFSLDFN